MPGDLFPATQDHDLLDKTLHQDVLEPVRGRRRIIIAAIAHQCRRRHAGRPLLARLQRRRWQGSDDRRVGRQTLADRLSAPSSPVRLASQAAHAQHPVERFVARGDRDRRHEVRPCILHESFDLPLVVALAGSSKPILEQVVADQFGERPRALALAIPANLRHRDLEIVVEDRQRHAAKKLECRYVSVEEGLRRLRRIGLHEAGVRLRQIHAEEMNLLAHPANHAHRFAEIHLRMARRMRQRHEGLSPARPLDPYIILDDGVAAREPMLVAQTLENPLGRMTLLHWRCPVSLEDRLDHRNHRPQLRLLRRSLPHITRRHREPAHLRDSLPAQPKNTSRFPPALAIIENKLPNCRVNLHDKHPFGFPSSRGQRNALPLAGFYSDATANRRRSCGRLCHRRAHQRHHWVAAPFRPGLEAAQWLSVGNGVLTSPSPDCESS